MIINFSTVICVITLKMTAMNHSCLVVQLVTSNIQCLIQVSTLPGGQLHLQSDHH